MQVVHKYSPILSILSNCFKWIFPNFLFVRKEDDHMLTAAKSASFIYAFKSVGTVSRHIGPISGHTLSYKVSGITEYFQGDNHIVTSPGKVVFMPKESVFSTNIVEPGEYIEMKFTSLDTPDPMIKLYSGFNAKEMEKAFREAISSYASKDESAFFNCQIQLNKVFALIAQSANSYVTSYERQLLFPALDYLKTHIYDPSFSVREMQSKVDISDTQFRKLFIKRFHMTPQRYVISERIQLAKSMLIDNPTVSLQQIAEAVGYTDAFYFSRIFKKELNESPSHFAKRAQAEQLSASFD